MELPTLISEQPQVAILGLAVFESQWSRPSRAFMAKPFFAAESFV